jgi:hypothetical protein
MAKLAFHWGFDGLATYNVLPIEGGSSSKVIANVHRAIVEDSVRWEDALVANFNSISRDLASADALLIAWGDRRGVPFFQPTLSRLFALLDTSRAPSTWAFDKNRRHDANKTSPRHAYLSADAHKFDFAACRPLPFARSLFLKE